MCYCIMCVVVTVAVLYCSPLGNYFQYIFSSTWTENVDDDRPVHKDNKITTPQIYKYIGSREAATDPRVCDVMYF